MALQQAILAATAEIERMCFPRKFVAANYTLDYDGSRARGRYQELLYLDHWPLITLTSVTEDGVALTTGTGYSTSIQVLSEADRGILRRRYNGADTMLAEVDYIIKPGWHSGYQNVAVAYRAGYEDPINEIPDLAQACIELAVLIYKQGSRTGSEQSSRRAGSVSYASKLPERTLRTIHRYAEPLRPRCRSAA